jgi:hypothetical protein
LVACWPDPVIANVVPTGAALLRSGWPCATATPWSLWVQTCRPCVTVASAPHRPYEVSALWAPLNLIRRPCVVVAGDHPSTADACWRAPPTVAGESGKGFARCAGNRHPNPQTPSSRRQHLPVHASHYRGRVQERLHTVWWRPAPPTSRRGRMPVCASHCHWVSLGVAPCGVATLDTPFLSSRRRRLPVRAFYLHR